MFVPKEDLTSQVTGTAVTFTLTNPIYQIDDVFVDGVVYTGTISYTSGGYTFTLGDAPQHTLFVDYYYGSAPTPGSLLVLSDVRASFLAYKKDLSDISDDLFIQWCNTINNFAYRYLMGVCPDRFIKSGTVSYVVGTDNYALPTDFRDIMQYGCGLYLMNSDGTVGKRLPITNYGSTTAGYYINRNRLYITGYNSNQTFTLRYIPMLTDFQQMTDTFVTVIPSEFIKYIIDALDVQYAQYDEDLNYEPIADQRFVRSLEELGRKMSQQNFGMLPDFTNNYF